KRRTTASDIFLQRAKDIRSYDSHVYYTYMLQIASNTYPARGWVTGRPDVVSWPFRLGNGPLGQTTHPREFRASSPPRIVIKFTICGASTFLPGKLLTAVEVSLVIRKSVQDGEGAINLIYEYQPEKLVRQRDGTAGEEKLGPLTHLAGDPPRSADDKRHRAVAADPLAFYIARQLLGRKLLARDVGDDDVARRQRFQDGFSLATKHPLALGRRVAVAYRFLTHFDDLHFGKGPQAFAVFLDAATQKRFPHTPDGHNAYLHDLASLPAPPRPSPLRYSLTAASSSWPSRTRVRRTVAPLPF